MKIKELYIQDYKVFKDFELNLTDTKGEALPLVVIAGINGSGKTTLLEFMAKRPTHPELANPSSIVIDASEYVEKNIHLGNRVRFSSMPNILGDVLKHMKKGVDDKFSVFNRIFEQQKIITEGELFNCYLNQKMIYMAVSHQHLGGLELAIQTYVDDVIYNHEASARVAYEGLRERLSTLFSSFELAIQFKTLNQYKKVFFTNKRGEEIELSQLSTGEQALLSKLFYFYLADINDSVILIDEPELSLHPKWQSHIVALYQQLAKEKNNQVILATHSPQIIASTPAESLFLLVSENEKIVAKNANAFGMTVNDVLLKVMQVDSLRDPDIQMRYDNIKQQLLNGSYRQSNQFINDLTELEKLLVNDPLEIGILRAEKLRQDKKYAAS